MTAYAIFMQERSRNAAELQTHAKLLKLGKSGGTVLAAHGRQDVLEGAASEGVVMVSFPTMGRHRLL
ncbi:DUF1330 domain-containing protein (plasmid) [Rhizobium ruizarguesonis]|uniref:DUF1330 domain-containing protein n=1 Tax=Rhizobium ruizarguesonis TaxID=2081791 RepID=A0ACD5EH39_9HYPH|nr:DUF1330 domain-containing protein [Rhizobium leguminosarum]